MRKIDEKNFGVIKFSGDFSEKNQLIYNSQLYETSFGVYADVKLHANGNIADINLMLLNYKGIVDLGFHKNVDPICKYSPVLDDDGKIIQHIITLDFELKAVISEKTEYIAKVKLDDTLKNLKDIASTEDIFLKVTRELDPIWAHLPGRPPMNNGVFDNEFFFRDGTRFEERKVTNVPDYYYETDRNKVYPDLPFFLDPGFNCKQASLRIIR